MSVRLIAALSILAVLTAALIAFDARPDDRANAGGIITQDLSGSLEPDNLVDALVGGGVTTSNVTYTGANVAAGTFAGAGDSVGFNSGVILSTGDISFVVGPNQLTSVAAMNGTAGDTDLNTLSGFTTFDAAVLEFDFVPQTDIAVFRFVFASDEYNEFVNTQFNDAFAFFVNGTNCAVVPGGDPDPITINTINNGNPFGTPPVSNPSLYRNNDARPGPIDTEMDGLTVILTCLAAVNPGVNNHLKLAIADASDDDYDSVVFIQAESLVGSGPGDTDCNGMINSVDALFVLRNNSGTPDHRPVHQRWRRQLQWWDECRRRAVDPARGCVPAQQLPARLPAHRQRPTWPDRYSLSPDEA
jgi:hypothetical protein